MVEDVQEGHLAVLLPEHNPEGVDELKYSRVEKNVADADMFHGLGAAVVLVDGLKDVNRLVNWWVVSWVSSQMAK